MKDEMQMPFHTYTLTQHSDSDLNFFMYKNMRCPPPTHLHSTNFKQKYFSKYRMGFPDLNEQYHKRS